MKTPIVHFADILRVQPTLYDHILLIDNLFHFKAFLEVQYTSLIFFTKYIGNIVQLLYWILRNVFDCNGI